MHVVVYLPERLPQAERGRTACFLLAGDVGGALFLFSALGALIALGAFGFFAGAIIALAPTASTRIAFFEWLWCGGRGLLAFGALGFAPCGDLLGHGFHGGGVSAFGGEFELFLQLGWEGEFYLFLCWCGGSGRFLLARVARLGWALGFEHGEDGLG